MSCSYSNLALRRAIRKYVRKFGSQDTRYVISQFAKSYKATKQRVSGNLRSLKYDYKVVIITTVVPRSMSFMTA